MSISELDRDAVAQVEALERRVRELEAEARGLRELFEYAVLRPVDLVKLDGDPYYCYTRDLIYTLFAQEKPDAFVRNYALTDEDLQPPARFEFSVNEFLERKRKDIRRDEHWAKLLILAHLWLHDVEVTMLDVGANIGYSAVPCAKFMQRFGRANPIHCFEPGLAADLLPANIELNRVGGIVHAHRLAVSDRAVPMAFNSVLGHSVCDSVNDFRKHYPHMVQAMTRIVSATTIDHFVRERGIGGALFLKVDAEGHDWQVLRGARACFERGQVAAAIVEFVPHYLKEFITPDQMLIDLAQRHHLVSILALEKGHQWKANPLPDDEAGLRAFATAVARSPLRYTDIVAIGRHVPDAPRLVQRLLD